jgi:hypothetical protein
MVVELFMPLDEHPVDVRARAAAAAGVRIEDVTAATVIRRSLDARKGRPLGHRLVVDVTVGPPVPARPRPAPPRTLVGKRAVVVGSGPAGTFAALRLAEAGADVTIVEKGKPVQPRRHDLARLVRRGTLDASSNYCFGEGGAGTFSDGKLYTRVKDREAVREVLDLLVDHGADPDIRVDSRPHVGSNKLPLVLMGLRARLEDLGVAYRWSDELVGIDGGARLRSGDVLPADAIVLAVGHSARPTYEWLVAAGVATEPKPFAVGARVEHPQALIDEIQYGAAATHPLLPAAFYQLTAEAGERGCWSFCMCPGGWIVNSSTEAERLATNGMSLKRRDSPFANAALVVTVAPADVGAGPLAGVAFQRRIEEAAYRLGGGGYRAPAQRLTDFAAGRPTTIVGRSSYRPGIAGADLTGALPPFVASALRHALRAFDRTMKGFFTAEAQLVGVETRTSSPLRIVRDPDTLASPSHPSLYPCGEGAGYAGGIVSAAIDGRRVAGAIIRRG